MPTVLRIGKFGFFFYSNERNEPKHIHVESDDRYAKFWLEPVHLGKAIGSSPRELNELRKLVSENLNIFKERWNEYFSD